MPGPSSPDDARPSEPRFSPWLLAPLAIALLIAVPVLAVGSTLLTPRGDVWSHLAATVLPRYLANTGLLALGVGIGTAILGVATAWLVTLCRFPGSGVLAWALLLPMAMPAYVMAYAATDLLQFAGPVQSGLREAFGWTRADYWFPQIRSLGGAVLVMTLVYYPYVYLLARAAFLEQSVCALEVSRTLGRSAWGAFVTVALPSARPAIVAGVALALMEVLADFGTVQYFAVDTFTTGIYRTWFAMGEPVAAAQLAAVLMAGVMILLVIEQHARRSARFDHATNRYRHLPDYRLTGLAAIGAGVLCWLPVVLGFAVPTLALIRLAVAAGGGRLDAGYFQPAANSFLLAGLAAGLAVALSLTLAYGRRLHPSPLMRAAVRIAGLGYAVPGSVIAVGILIPFTAFDQSLDAVMRRSFGVSTGLLVTGTVAALLYAYLVRFLAVSLQTVEASLGKVRPSLDQAARVLGAGPGGTLVRVHLPLLRGGLLTAILLVFVDVLKELPATLIMRPFDFDTLAVRTYSLAADERLAEAAMPALTIVAVGLLPVILLSRAIARSRPGR